MLVVFLAQISHALNFTKLCTKKKKVTFDLIYYTLEVFIHQLVKLKLSNKFILPSNSS